MQEHSQADRLEKAARFLVCLYSRTMKSRKLKGKGQLMQGFKYGDTQRCAGAGTLNTHTKEPQRRHGSTLCKPSSGNVLSCSQ